MQYLIGFIIAAFIAMTGVGAGTITTPLLILFLDVPAAVAVITGLMFSAAIKLILVPSYLIQGRVNWRVLGYMLAGGLPGVLLGSLLLGHLASGGSKQVMHSFLGIVLLLTAGYQIVFSFRPLEHVTHRAVRKLWLAWLMLPVGAEVGFSSAGAGALGTAALLSLTDLEPAEVVATDILFGFLLSLTGSVAHWFSHIIDAGLLKHLVIGGIGGAIAGSVGARYVPKRPLRFALWIWLFVIGIQLLYVGLHRGH